MITVKIPNNNIHERKYILSIMFDEFLGINFEIIRDNNILDWIIELENGSQLIIKDHFFRKYPQDLEYLKLENIPSNIEFGQNDFIVEDNIPIIYGTDELKTNEQEQKTITCGIDIFASSFFMLSRWEEYVNKNRDNHNRFLAIESLAFKNDFLDRSVVNEYVEMLWSMLEYLGINQKRKDKEYQLFLTHDIDELYMWKSWKQVFRVALGDIIKRKSLALAFERISEYYHVNRNKINDPFDTFGLLMDESESVGLKSRFYFMSGGVTEYDNRYRIDEQKSLELIQKIKQRGHIIGIHPSYNAYNNFEQFKKEKEHLEKVASCKIVEGREHYLRFEVPTTWQIWDDNGMKIDSTCGYADKEGFRCGTGDEFNVFNILTRKKLKLKERPLVVMDCSLFDYNSYSYNEASKIMNRLQKNTNDFTLLWHNSYTKHMKFYRDRIESKK